MIADDTPEAVGDDAQESRRCGYVALLGRPNAGKSTLLNAIVGNKIAGVSRKPQTTRNRILGVALCEQTQIVFLDTPGLHKKGASQHLLNATMNRIALQAAQDADLIIYMVDAAIGWKEEDHLFFEKILRSGTAPILVLASKSDAIKKMQVGEGSLSISFNLERILQKEDFAGSRERLIFDQAMSFSSKRPEELLELKELISERMPEGEWLFNEDDLTDRPQSFVVGEFIREQLFRQLGREIPFGCAVRVDSIEDKPNITSICATIVVSRSTHKPIVLGKGGSRIKTVGSEARQSLERHFDKKVFLELAVRVTEGWMDDQRLIAELAHVGELDLPSDHTP